MMVRAWTMGVGLGLAAAAAAVQPGESIDDVVNALGPPRSYLVGEARAVYHYDRGRVVFTNGVVAAVDLVEPMDVVDERRRERLRAEQREAERRAAEEARRIEGLALRGDKRSDPSFRASPAAEQAAFWRDFARRYPSVSVEEELEGALRHMQFEARRADAARRRAEAEALRRQLWDIERRAIEAERESARAREQAAWAQALALEASRRSTVQQAEDPDRWEVVTFWDASRVWPHPTPPAQPVEPKSAPWGRYSVEQRLPPQGRPVFGGRSGAFEQSP